jgi:pyruvate dehydrogenase complex dehydrogenase (E1) component
LPRIVSVNDGISQALSWVGTAIGVAQIPLGSDQGPRPDGVDLRDRSEISAALIVNAALLALEQED